jgi:hypothetical protein
MFATVKAQERVLWLMALVYAPPEEETATQTSRCVHPCLVTHVHECMHACAMSLMHASRDAFANLSPHYLRPFICIIHT